MEYGEGNGLEENSDYIDKNHLRSSNHLEEKAPWILASPEQLPRRRGRSAVIGAAILRHFQPIKLS